MDTQDPAAPAAEVLGNLNANVHNISDSAEEEEEGEETNTLINNATTNTAPVANSAPMVGFRIVDIERPADGSGIQFQHTNTVGTAHNAAGSSDTSPRAEDNTPSNTPQNPGPATAGTPDTTPEMIRSEANEKMRAAIAKAKEITRNDKKIGSGFKETEKKPSKKFRPVSKLTYLLLGE